MNVTFACPKCKRLLKGQDRAIGSKSPCPFCKTLVLVPHPGVEYAHMRCQDCGSQHELDHAGECEACDADDLAKWCGKHRSPIPTYACSDCLKDQADQLLEESLRRKKKRERQKKERQKDLAKESPRGLPPKIESSEKESKNQEDSSFATMSLLFGLLSWTVGCFCFLYVPLGLAAVITGIRGLDDVHNGKSGAGLAIAGLVLGALALFFITLFMMGALLAG